MKLARLWLALLLASGVAAQSPGRRVLDFELDQVFDDFTIVPR
jgi:hypothetical protein